MIFIYATKDLKVMNKNLLLNMKNDLKQAIKEIDKEIKLQQLISEALDLETPISKISSS